MFEMKNDAQSVPRLVFEPQKELSQGFAAETRHFSVFLMPQGEFGRESEGKSSAAPFCAAFAGRH